MRKAVFLDRDGVIVDINSFIRNVEDITIFPDAPRAVKLLKDNGYLVFIITNQGGISRGHVNI
ncbi:MAG: HAD-IIIA family hydrolase, partial [Actinomycetia bacterium]|nr:HAD-IIIA family hydrolase [Actinomycetes bacterium]